MLVELVVAGRELAFLAPPADRNEDGTVAGEEVRTATAALAEVLVEPLIVRSGADSCSGALQSATSVEADGVQVLARYRCPAIEGGLVFDLGFLKRMEVGHRHLFVGSFGGSPVERVAHVGLREVRVEVLKKAPQSGLAVAREALVAGIAAVLGGYDHLLFLFGVVIACSGLWSLVGAVVAFAWAHSLTLALAALGVYSPSAAVVGPLLALSVAYVGMENLLMEEPRNRWLLTLGFGLVHGFGLAFGLESRGFSANHRGLGLAMFNVGVEIGLMGAVLAAYFAILSLRRFSSPTARRTARIVSLLIVFAGLSRLIMALYSGFSSSR